MERRILEIAPVKSERKKQSAQKNVVGLLAEVHLRLLSTKFRQPLELE